MNKEMENYQKCDAYDEVDIDDLTPEEQAGIVPGRWHLTPKSDEEIRARYIAQGYA